VLPEIARRHGTRVIDIGIVRDHVHVVLELPPHADLPRLVQGLKGASARIANRDGVMPRAPLRWANGYDLRSLSVRDLRRAIRYVRSQSERHPEHAVDESPG
jgi:REP element-mobilizing transposase RayT